MNTTTLRRGVPWLAEVILLLRLHGWGNSASEKRVGHPKSPSLPNRSALFLKEIHVSAEGVTKLLKSLNPSKALGPDELHPSVLKELASELGPMFAHLFQQSIDTGEIPKEWSLANICPLYKKGDRSLACNYRPVSQTCIPCKLLEHIVWSDITSPVSSPRLKRLELFDRFPYLCYWVCSRFSY